MVIEVARFLLSIVAEILIILIGLYLGNTVFRGWEKLAIIPVVIVIGIILIALTIITGVNDARLW